MFTSQPKIVGEVFTGVASANPQNLINIDGVLYFTVNDSSGRSYLTRLDSNGNSIPVRTPIGNIFGNIQNLTNVNGKLYFTVSPGFGSAELWTLDSQGNGVRIPNVDLWSKDATNPIYLANINNTLYFRGFSKSFNSGNQLWRLDGNGQPVQFTFHNPGINNANPENLTQVGNTLYFVVNNGTNGRELWRAEGNNRPTRVTDINPGFGSSNPQNLTVFENTLFFTATNANNQTRLYRIDNQGNPSLISNIPQLTAGFTFANINGNLYLTIPEGATRNRFFRLDSPNNFTPLEVRQFGTSNPIFNPTNFTQINSITYFTAENSTQGRELWMLNDRGEASLVADILQGFGSSNPANLTNINGTLFFTANNGINGTELWRLDGNGRPLLVTDINPGSGNSNPSNITVINGTIYFTAENPTNGREIWAIDTKRVNIAPVNILPINQGTQFMTEDTVLVFNTANRNTILIRDDDAGNGSLEVTLRGRNGSISLSRTNGLTFITGDGTVDSTVTFRGNIADINAALLGMRFIAHASYTGVAGIEVITDDLGSGTGNTNRLVDRDFINIQVNKAFSAPNYIPHSQPRPLPELAPGLAGVEAQNLIMLNGNLYFTINDKGTGVGLWRMGNDGILDRIDRLPGTIPEGSTTNPQFILENVRNLTNLNNNLYFTANDGTGNKLWQLNQSGNPIPVTNFPFPSNFNLSNLTVANGNLFFTTSDNFRTELWRFNGNTPPSRITSFNSVLNNFNLVNVNNTVYFNVVSNSFSELWRIDGNGSPINMFFPRNISNMTNVNGSLYFTSFVPSNVTAGVELFRVENNNQISRVSSIHSSISNLTNVNGSLFFTTEDSMGRMSLMRIDANIPRTIFISSLQEIKNLTNLNGTLYFTGSDQVNGTRLLRVDNNSNAVQQIPSMNGLSNNFNPSNLTVVNGTLYFTATDTANDTELWQLDNRNGTLVRVADINPGIRSSNPTNLTNVNGALFFSAENAQFGRELWVLGTPTPNPVTVIPSLNVIPTTILTTVEDRIISSNSFNSPHGGIISISNVNYNNLLRVTLTATNGRLSVASFLPSSSYIIGDGYADTTMTFTGRVIDINNSLRTLAFAPDTNFSGTATIQINTVELFDGNTIIQEDKDTIIITVNSVNDAPVINSIATNRPKLVADILPGAFSSLVDNFVDVNGTLYFAADGNSGRDLWRLDKQGNAVRVADINPGFRASRLSNLTLVENILYFTAEDGTSGRELWKIDNQGNTSRVADIASGLSNFNPSSLTNVNGTLYFTAWDSSNGTEIWKLDSQGNLVRVTDIAIGSASSFPNNLTNINGTLYFRASDSINGAELWKLDSKGHAVRLTDIASGSIGSWPSNFTDVNGTLYFTANDGINGTELWRLDSQGNASLVKDINPGTNTSFPSNFININSTLYFTAGDGVNGTELWKIDSQGNAVLVKDINPGLNSSSPHNLINFNGTLYFTAYDNTNGSELWKIDNQGNPVLVTDLFPGANGSSPSNFRIVNDTLYFTANNNGSRQLWKLDSQGNPVVVSRMISNSSNFTHLNGSFYFVGDNNNGTGGELWSQEIEPKPQTTNEDTPLIFNASNNNIISITDVDAENNSLHVQLTASNGNLTLNGSNGLTFIWGDGISDASMTFVGTLVNINAALNGLSFNPNANFSGLANVAINVNDQGSINSSSLQDSANIAIQVNSVNDIPVVTNESLTTNEDTPLIIRVADLISNDTDIDSDTLTITGFAQPTNGTLIDNGDRTFTYRPKADYFGADSFDYTISDGKGGTSTGTVNLTLNGVEDAPIAIGERLTINEDTSLIIRAADLMSNDTDADGDALIFTGITQPTNGQLVDNRDGTYIYTPKANYFGNDSLTYTVSDGKGNTATGTVNLTVNSINDAPIATGESLTTKRNRAITFASSDLLKNDTDIDNDNLTISNISLQPRNGSLVNNGNGTYIYNPGTNYFGTDSFDYVVNDGKGGTSRATVNLLILNTIQGTLGNDVLNGSSLADEILGLDGNDRIFGGQGNDILLGGNGNDTLLGDFGDDQLYGGLGRDTLTGGNGQDNFYLNDALTRNSSDIITDFNAASGDKIFISRREFGLTQAEGVLEAASFRLGSSATTSNQRFIYNQSNGALLFDADGTGATNAVLIAQMSNRASLSSSNIFVMT
jgi:ELWxxDGT repeat protein